MTEAVWCERSLKANSTQEREIAEMSYWTLS